MAQNGKKLSVLADAVQLLLQERSLKFALERQLRLFQFQSWLLGTGSQNTCFYRARLIYAVALTSDRLLPRSSKEKYLDPSERLIAAFKSDGAFRELFDRCFKEPATFYSALEKEPFPTLQGSYASALDEIRSINSLTGVWLGLKVQNARITLTQAIEANEKMGGLKSTTMKKVRKRRGERQAFLFAALKSAPAFLELQFTEDGNKVSRLSHNQLLSQITVLSKQSDTFKQLCASAKAIASMIDPELFTELEGSWGCVPPALPDLDSIDIDLAEKRVRRSATETNAGHRRQVG
jgi:hypothetical protein